MTAPATVEAVPDFRTGRVGYRITSIYSPAAVQQSVAEIMAGENIVHAEFTRVRHLPAVPGRPQCWGALGYTIGAEIGAERYVEDDEYSDREHSTLNRATQG